MGRKNYGSNIPFARELLHEVATNISTHQITRQQAADEINRIVSTHMHQRPPKKVARTEHRPMTRAQKQKALQLRDEGMSVQSVADQVGCNPGRVSEADNGI